MTSAATDHIPFQAKVASASARPVARTPRESFLHAVVLLTILSIIGCSPRADAPPPSPASSALGSGGSGAASISADPNPVPAGPDKFGTTKVTWDTGDGTVGEVYVSVNGQPEKLFAGNRPNGSLEAPWIGKGDHEFRLYAGKEHKTVLASVKVIRAKRE